MSNLRKSQTYLKKDPLGDGLTDLPLFAQPPKHWTVSELTNQIRSLLEPAFVQIWVQGEISNYRPASSGHVYFSLKDQDACIGAAIFGWNGKKKSFDLREGLQVLCRGKISVYPPRGNYQLVVDHVEPLGVGALQLAFEQLKARLAQEGLFDAATKRTLPRFPTRIAVVTSPSGAAIQDILNILKRRAPHIPVVIVPSLVQGEEAPGQMISALELVNQHQLGDLIILARGGGSIEDLWCFNHEGLARAIRKSSLPVVSAVGHEIDFTISDFVSDLRAPTPSAAAEIVSQYYVDAYQNIHEMIARLSAPLIRNLLNRKSLLSLISARVVSPKDRLREQAQRTDDLCLRLERAFHARFEKKQASLKQLVGKLDALSPLRVLERGYALVRDPNSNWTIVKSGDRLQSGQELQVIFYDSQRSVQVL